MNQAEIYSITENIQKQNDSRFTPKDVDEEVIIQIDKDVIKLNFELNCTYEALPMIVTYHSPKIFNYFQSIDRVNLDSSLNLNNNIEYLLNLENPSGGKSGEFFFFSSDKQIIIKTIQKEELEALGKRILGYANYLTNYPNSLISRIYGLFTFQQLTNQEDIHSNESILVILMQNLQLGAQSSQIERTFDLKGSEYDREVLIKNPNAELEQKTLKDIDFFKKEKQVWLERELKEKILKILTNDARFFQQMRLIDYSLLIIKVNWGQTDLNQRRINNLYQIIQSEQDEEIYYHIGIIDYLQEWNLNKELEKATKQLITLNCKLDTSAQNPDIYAERFITKLLQRIFLLN